MVGSEVLAATLRRRTHAELVAHTAWYEAQPLGTSYTTLGQLGAVVTALEELEPSWAQAQQHVSDVAVLALASVLRRPVVRLSSPEFADTAAPGTFLPRPSGPGERAALRRPLLLAWANVDAEESPNNTPVHYVALQRRRGGPAGPLALPEEMWPKSWPLQARMFDEEVEWANVAAVCAELPDELTGQLSARGFVSYDALLTSLTGLAQAELRRLGLALPHNVRMPEGSALVALDSLFDLFYSICGFEGNLTTYGELPFEALDTALTSPRAATPARVLQRRCAWCSPHRDSPTCPVDPMHCTLACGFLGCSVIGFWGRA